MKSKLLLLDANVIIEASRLGFWKTLYTQFEISVPSVVVNKEVQYFESKSVVGIQQTAIVLAPLIESGDLKEATATIADMAVLSLKFKPAFLEVLGDGEKEAIALLLVAKVSPDTRFSTADGPAIKALGALTMGSNGVSFEELLNEVGQTNHVSKLKKHYRRDFFEKNLSLGRMESSMLCV